MFPPDTSNEKIKTWVVLQLWSHLFSAFCFRKQGWVLVYFLVTAVVLPPFFPGFSFNARNFLQSDEARGKYNRSFCLLFFSWFLGFFFLFCSQLWIRGDKLHFPPPPSTSTHEEKHTLSAYWLEPAKCSEKFSLSWYYLLINPELMRHLSQKEEPMEMAKSVEIQKSVKCSFNCLSYTWNLIYTEPSASN